MSDTITLPRAVAEQALHVATAAAYPVALIAALKAALEQTEQADWTHLKRYGYAPGDHMSKCCRCGESVSGLNKRAVTCKPCAEARHSFEQAAALEQPEQATPVAWIDIEEDGTCHGLRYWSEPGRREHALYPHPPRRDTGQKPVAWMYVDAHEPLNRHLEWTEDRKGYRGDWIKTPLYEAKLQPEQAPCPYVRNNGAGTHWCALAEQQKPEPPPEAQTESERVAYCAGWWAAMEQKREQPAQEPVAGRSAFERHAQSLGYSVDPDTRPGREGGYWSSHTHLMWETWQAALAEPEQEPVAWVNEVMSQAQVFASAWSLVGGRFDDGNGMADAEQAKQELRSMLLAAPPRREPLTVTELQQAMVDVDLIDPDAIDDPEGFDNGFTLQQIDALHSRLMQTTPPTTTQPEPK